MTSLPGIEGRQMYCCSPYATSALWGGGGSAPRPICITPPEIIGTHGTGAWHMYLFVDV